MEYINYEDFKKLDMRIGWIRFVESVQGTDKLLRFEIDFGESNTCNEECQETCICDIQCDLDTCIESCVCESLVGDIDNFPFGKKEYEGRDVRQIVSGIREFFPKYQALVGKKALYVVNLEPRKIRGIESHGMLMAVDGLDNSPVFLVPEGTVESGSQVR